MKNIDQKIIDIGYLDFFAEKNSIIHRIDPRAKLITTIAFIVAVVSFDKYAVSSLVAFMIYPIFMIVFSGMSFRFLLKKILLVMPFVFFIGIVNSFFDRNVIVHVGSLGITGGWISFLSILLRFVLTVSSVLTLIAVTGLNSVCMALERLGIPKEFVIQIMFFYRYIFVLSDEASRMTRARALRTFNSKIIKWNDFVLFVGQLLLRTMARSERIYIAMCCRGFDGHVRNIRSIKSRPIDFIFGVSWVLIFILFRSQNVSFNLGQLIMGMIK